MNSGASALLVYFEKLQKIKHILKNNCKGHVEGPSLVASCQYSNGVECPVRLNYKGLNPSTTWTPLALDPLHLLAEFSVQFWSLFHQQDSLIEFHSIDKKDSAQLTRHKQDVCTPKFKSVYNCGKKVKFSIFFTSPQ